jgi:large subunit ribosomal protein L3
MTLKLMGIKKGMARIYDKEGNLVVCTVIAAEPNIVSQIKRVEKDGYNAIQLSAIKVTAPKVQGVTKPLRGHFKKAGIEPRKHLAEARIQNPEEYQIGQEIGVGYFDGCEFVDVVGDSKGKGYQGVIKRHHFAGGPAAHGSGFHRHGGSCGMRTSPGRCLPGQKKAGRMGHERVTQQNLKVVMVDAEKNVLVVQGAIPGARGGLVYSTKAMKKPAKDRKQQKKR